MDDRGRELVKSILRRAMEEGREGRVQMIQSRLRAAREIPPEHQMILKEIALFGRALPKNPFMGGLWVN